jgi:hypothetical protein
VKISDKYLIPTNIKKECCLVAPNGTLYGLDWGEQDFMPHLDMAKAIVADGLFDPDQEIKAHNLDGYYLYNYLGIMEAVGWVIIRGDSIKRYCKVNVTEAQWKTLVDYFKNNYEGICYVNESNDIYRINRLSEMEPLAFNELCIKTL